MYIQKHRCLFSRLVGRKTPFQTKRFRLSDNTASRMRCIRASGKSWLGVTAYSSSAFQKHPESISHRLKHCGLTLGKESQISETWGRRTMTPLYTSATSDRAISVAPIVL